MLLTDTTNSFLALSVSGNQDFLIIYKYGGNYIHDETMKDPTGLSIIAAFKGVLVFNQISRFQANTSAIRQRSITDHVNSSWISKTLIFILHCHMRIAAMTMNVPSEHARTISSPVCASFFHGTTSH
jgi:hypothetical protein